MDYVTAAVVLIITVTKFRGSEESPYYVDTYPEVTEYASKSVNNHSVPLYFGLMLSLSGDDQSSGALAGVQAALDEINSRDDLLPGYSLHYTLTDSEVLLVAIKSLSITTPPLLYAVQPDSCSLWTLLSAH
jgi:hypothetical protein